MLSISGDQATPSRFLKFIKWFSISCRYCTTRPRCASIDSDITWHSYSILRISNRFSVSSQSLQLAIFLRTWGWFDTFYYFAPLLISRSFRTEWYCNAILLCDKKWRKQYYLPNWIITERMDAYVLPFYFICSSLRKKIAICFACFSIVLNQFSYKICSIKSWIP